VPVRPRARRCEPCLAIRRLPLPLLLQRLSGVRAFSRPTGRAGPGGRNGHLPDAARALESHSRHGRPTSLRLSDRGVLRWYTDCCRTPIANGAGAGFPIISMIHSFVDHDAGGHSSDEVFGPPLCRIYEGSAIGPLPSEAPPPPSLRVFARRWPRQDRHAPVAKAHGLPGQGCCPASRAASAVEEGLTQAQPAQSD
jgi:Family of unknown function (DUF6151)